MREIGRDLTEPAKALPIRLEIRDGRGQEQQGGGEDRRNDARGVDLQRQMRGLAADHLVADLPLWVLDENSPLRALHEHDEADHADRHRQEDDDEHRGDRPGAAELEGGGQGERQVRYDPGNYDKEDAVTEATPRHMLTGHPTTP